ncbi:MAG: type II secretion system GspH family protein [Puniceicoccales bacterium]|nr:type II secretion system GspH family protein [Puniceicoccales bacterium]
MKTQHHRNYQHRRGFTLIELLVAITIMALLAGALVAIIPQVQTMAARSNASGKLKGIVTAYIAYSSGGSRQKPIYSDGSPKEGGATSPAQFAEVLARYTELNDATSWYIERDKQLDGVEIPKLVLKNDANQLSGVKPISWAVVTNAATSPDANYPLVWTRGLDTGGEWNKDSPWGERGGHIAFGDGHIQFFESLKLKGQKLIHRKTNEETSSYQDAVGEKARVLEDK